MSTMAQLLATYGQSAISVSALVADLISAKNPPAPLVGAKGDSTGIAGNGTDDTTALQALLDYCSTNNKTLFLPDGIYRTTSALTVKRPIVGRSMLTTIIFNDGTGDALVIQTPYYCTFSDFTVRGTSSSRDGIVNSYGALDAGFSTDYNCSYLTFINIRSDYNGRHGLNHVNSWATRYIGCKFQYNEGLGAWFHGTDGTVNNILSIGTDYRWNGGSSAATTFDDDCGGLKIETCNGIHFIGGVIESNNAWGVILEGTGAKYAPFFENIWTENNGASATVGGVFYIDGSLVRKMIVKDSYLIYGTETAENTNYLYYVEDTVPINRFYDDNNYEYYVTGGTVTREYRPYLRDKSGVNVSSSMVSMQSATWTKVGTTFVDNFVNFEIVEETDGYNIVLVKNFWTAAEISEDSDSPTKIATAYTFNMYAYKDAGNFLYVKWDVAGMNYPTYFKTSFA